MNLTTTGTRNQSLVICAAMLYMSTGDPPQECAQPTKATVSERARITIRLMHWLVLMSLPLAAAQPFFTDDAATTAQGVLHLEFFNEHDWLKSTQFPSLRQNTAKYENQLRINGHH